MIVVNLYAGPGAGKSTTAAAIFAELKMAGVNCEYVHEWIKWKVWEKHWEIVNDQLFIFANQFHMQWSLLNQVDVCICDSPLLLSLIYGELYEAKQTETFYNLVREKFHEFDNVNYFLERRKKYNPKGRLQTEEEARAIDVTTKEILTREEIPFTEVIGNRDGVTYIVNEILGKLATK